MNGFKGKNVKYVIFLFRELGRHIIGIYNYLSSRVCGKPVCKSCSNKLINDRRACDLCFMRVKMAD